MKKYKFKFKRFLFWRCITAVGHTYIKDMDRMDVFDESGGILSLSKWSAYDLKLGTDWVLATKDKMEKEAGTKINLSVGQQ
jgi:predicted RecA/RadA family phage recombinase